MPDLTLEEADRCPHCDEIIRLGHTCKKSAIATLIEDQAFDLALAKFLSIYQDFVNEYFRINYSNLTPPTFTAEYGTRNVKIIRNESHNNGRSVFCFIDKATGDILKAAGWKAPEPKRIPRGNIYAVNPIEGCGPHGIKYLR